LFHKRKHNRELAKFNHIDALKELAEILDLTKPPVMMEGYDISNIQGKQATGSKVTFKDGKPYKTGYRRFKIQTKASPDDPKMMAEIIFRRFKRVVEGRDDPPDLIVVDGGKGQLNAAVKQLELLNQDHLSLIGLAKEHEEIFLPGIKDPIILPEDSKARLLLQKIRDESHRFAVKYHRKLRSKKLEEPLKSLMQITGVGKQRAARLLKQFRTVENLKNASIDEIQDVIGLLKVSKAVYDHFNKK
jgi:excinuclease ABC subunit C